MAQYISLEKVEAIQWFKNGDHPRDNVGELVVDWGMVGELRPELLERINPIDDADIPAEAYYTKIEGEVVRFFRLPPPGPNGLDICHICSRMWCEHGWIDESTDGVPEGGLPVCPGDWIVEDIHGGYQVVNPIDFASKYKLVGYDAYKLVEDTTND